MSSALNYPLKLIGHLTKKPKPIGELKYSQRQFLAKEIIKQRTHTCVGVYIYISTSSSSSSFIASGRSSGLHPVSSHSCCMYVRAGRPAFAQPYVGVPKSTSRISSSLLLQQCHACLVWIVFVIGGRWPYSWCLVGCCRQDLFNIARKCVCVCDCYNSMIITTIQSRKYHIAQREKRTTYTWES